MAFKKADIAAAIATAREQATAESFYKLGLMYSTGDGGPIDLVEAHKWFNLAALRGLSEAKACRRECADMMSKSEIAAAQRGARELLDALGIVITPLAPPAPPVAPLPVEKAPLKVRSRTGSSLGIAA